VPLELGDVAERRDVDRQDRLAGVRGALEIGVEVEHVLAHRRPVQRAGKQSDDEREPVALVAADRQQEALVRALRVGDRTALAVDHPPLRHRLAQLCPRLDLAVGGDGRCHVQDHRGFLEGRNRRRDRVGGEEHVDPAPRRQVVRVADREVEPDHVVRERHARIERRRPGVVAPLRPDPGDAGGARLLDREVGGPLHHEVAHPVVAVHERHPGALAQDADVRAHVDPARLDAPHVRRQPDHPVAVGALQVGLGHQAAERARVVCGNADALEGRGDEVAQTLERDAGGRRVQSGPAARLTTGRNGSSPSLERRAAIE
jgi:hypothetical protein